MKSSGNVFKLLLNTISFTLNNSIAIYQEKQKAKLEIQKMKTRLASQKDFYNSEQQLNQLEGKSSALQRLCFVILLAPFFWGIIDPAGVQTYFKVVVDPLPDWYVEMVVVIIGAVWGITQLGGGVGRGIGTVIDTLKNRRQETKSIDTRDIRVANTQEEKNIGTKDIATKDVSVTNTQEEKNRENIKDDTLKK